MIPTITSTPATRNAQRRISIVLLGNGLARVAGGAGGALVGLYLASLANQGRAVDAVLVGALASISFVGELLLVVPMGVLADKVAPRWLMVAGALLGALATQLFGLSGAVSIFFLSRAIEGAASAASTPSILAHLTDATDGDASLRGKVMSYFELSLLVGLALGGLVGGLLWRGLGAGAFAAVAGIYALCAILFWLGGSAGARQTSGHAAEGLLHVLRDRKVQRLAPAWICINAITGLWLGSTLQFLFTLSERRGQFLTGLFYAEPQNVGLVTLGYAIVFAVGVTAWSVVLPRLSRRRALRTALVAMLAACGWLYALNHSQDISAGLRWLLIVGMALTVMVESGFTPAALSLLADATGSTGGRGAAMGIYSVLLTVGNIIGNGLAGYLGNAFAFDGLIIGTVGLAVVALATVALLPRE